VDTSTTAGHGADSEHPIQQQQQSAPKRTGRLPPFIVTTTVNLQKFEDITKGGFEIRTSQNGLRVVRREDADYSAIILYLDAYKIPYYTLNSKSMKLLTAVIRHLPGDTHAEDISKELVALA